MQVVSLLKPEVKGWFTEAGHAELYASHLYQYLGNQMQRLGLFGAQEYFHHESLEERKHYQKLADFQNDLGDMAEVPSLEAIVLPVNSLMEALIISYNTEKDLMYQYVEFYKKAEDVEDCITSTFLIEFMQIQRKSVGEYGDLISRLNRMGDIYEMDKFMKKLANA